MKNLSMLVIELVLLRLYRADDAGHRQRCSCCEMRSAASRLEGGESGTVHAHDGSLAGRGVGRLAVSQATLLE